MLARTLASRSKGLFLFCTVRSGGKWTDDYAVPFELSFQHPPTKLRSRLANAPETETSSLPPVLLSSQSSIVRPLPPDRSFTR